MRHQTCTSDQKRKKMGRAAAQRLVEPVLSLCHVHQNQNTHSDPYRASCNGDQGWLAALVWALTFTRSKVPVGATGQ